ncbi:uncharacterized protein ATNIH1004_008724 [Aspergillus tanneri]|uniref:Uncharacterized protein n=1 Tax=Aspergillus tanneri TaxID=1220188 RepID=A0A5M9MGE0_9EURO|nr:uncharacterized protein ATNIH1004_008724 [Aspergillus tanneri]KAA8644520.1 hypothetical protein ATNIH1004_008724 [Aspergillus tanneri]
MVFSIDFVVSDDMHEKAVLVLLAAGFHYCKAGPGCILHRSFANKPVSAAHLHLDRHRPLRLYKQSEILWAYPTLPTEKPEADSLHYILGNDPRLREQKKGFPPCCGRYYDSLHPVKMPHPTKLVEALIFLVCRDQDPNPEIPGYESVWFLWYMHLLMYVGESGLLLPDQLDPQFLPVWNEARYDKGNPGRRLRSIKRLQATLWGLQALPQKVR